MTVPRKRHIIRNLKIREISSVDNPAQLGAVSVLMKRADGECADIRKNAAAVAAGEGSVAEAQQLATDDQAKAFGFMCAFADLISSTESR